MANLELKAAPRLVAGKKVATLRRQGITPAHLFGPGIASEAIQVETGALQQILAEAGHTKLVNLRVGKEKKPRTVMVREIQFNNRNNSLIHVDFYQVDLTEKTRVEVPVRLTGESSIAKMKGNTLVQELNEVTVECLPAGIPEAIEVDISSLQTTDDMIRIKDITLPADVTVVNDPDVVVARIAVEKGETVIEKAESEADTAVETAAEEKKA